MRMVGNQIWPSSVTFAEGRLWWSGSDRLWGSVSDGFEDFDDTTEGDSGPISRSIATGGVNDTQWMLGPSRLLIGTEGAVSTVKSSSFDEPLTPTNLSIKDSSSTGAARSTRPASIAEGCSSIDPARRYSNCPSMAPAPTTMPPRSASFRPISSLPASSRWQCSAGPIRGSGSS
jgi:hypothetical protein